MSKYITINTLLSFEISFESKTLVAQQALKQN